MGNLSFSWEQVIANQGLDLSFAGMVIVFSALTIISIAIALTPSILKLVNRFYPEPITYQNVKRPQESEEGVIAAIAVALHYEKAIYSHHHPIH